MVLTIRASISCSIKQLKAAAAPEAINIPTVDGIKICSGTNPGLAKNIPITAVNTIIADTRGLHSGKKFWKRTDTFCNWLMTTAFI
jgi:hypothetical protein